MFGTPAQPWAKCCVTQPGTQELWAWLDMDDLNVDQTTLYLQAIPQNQHKWMGFQVYTQMVGLCLGFIIGQIIVFSSGSK
jgi:hypothetical protein